MKTKKILQLFTIITVPIYLSSCDLLMVGYAMNHSMNKKFKDLEASNANALVNPDNRARVRFFGNGAIELAFYRNQMCYGKVGETKVSSRNVLLSPNKSTSLGMPMTPRVANVNNQGRFTAMISQDSYREFVFNAGEPVTVKASYFVAGIPARPGSRGTPSYSCPDFGVYFTPEKGMDYEVYLDVNRSEKACMFKISVISPKIEGGIEVIPVNGAFQRATQKCSY